MVAEGIHRPARLNVQGEQASQLPRGVGRPLGILALSSQRQRELAVIPIIRLFVRIYILILKHEVPSNVQPTHSKLTNIMELVSQLSREL
jgi:hypothetical protein